LFESPVARAILKAAHEANGTFTEPENFRQIVGKGIEAMVDGKQVFVGAVNEGGPDYEKIKNEDHFGTILIVKQSEEMVGYLAISDSSQCRFRFCGGQLGIANKEKFLILSKGCINKSFNPKYLPYSLLYLITAAQTHIYKLLS
jgi:hypothetical protein